MICNHCQKESDSPSRVCPYCGRFMGDPSEPAAMGDAVPVYDDSDYRPKERAPKPGEKKRKGGRRRKKKSGRAEAKRRKRENYRGPMINWAMIGLVLLIVSFAAGLGSYVYLQLTPGGQLILARMGREANADAYWTLGGEYLDQGYIIRSVETYEKALALDPDHPDLVSRLMLLGEAYETAGNAKAAEEVYTRIYQELSPKDSLGYRNVIRLMLQQERLHEAVDLMKTAAENTGDQSFTKQRAGYVPLPPTATVASGRYLISKTVEFVSSQGYEIYYTTGAGQLPEDGTLYSGPITLGEGSHTFRAVCVSSNLPSDEMNIKYVVTLPTPPSPKATLQAGEYDGVRSVKLRDMKENKKDPDNTLYYTVDGTPPRAGESPRYTGEPIKLVGGRITLRAIAVNSYGKVSNEMNVSYKINKVKVIEMFNGSDEFGKFTLLKTSFEDFSSLYGEPLSYDKIEDEDIIGQSYEALYSFGKARFVQTDIGQLIYYISTNDPGMTGPRRVSVGMDMEDITGLFRDMGQLPNERGDRGIYYNIDSGYASYKVASDDPTTGELLYAATLFSETAYTRMLTFDIEAGKAARITFRHIDRKVSNII